VEQGRLLLIHVIEARPLRQNANRAAPCQRWPDGARPSDQRLKTFVTLAQPPSEPLHDLTTERAVPPDQGRQPGTELKIERVLAGPYRAGIDGIHALYSFNSLLDYSPGRLDLLREIHQRLVIELHFEV
jgi:hypothetical protein